MRISGAAIVRNGVKFGYPFIESIRSVLPLVSEFIVCVGNSDDDTRRKIESINDPKIKIIDTVWDDSKRTGGLVLSEQTNIALSKCSGDWIFYIQSDEAVNEEDYAEIRSVLEKADRDEKIDGIAFKYLHFYGSYSTVQAGRNWYKNEVRLIKNNRGIVSHGDAQGFRKEGKKLLALESRARIYHYGWARPPEIMMKKIKDFHKLWHEDEWIEKNCRESDFSSYFTDLGNLVPFRGNHPSVMKELIGNDSPDFILAVMKNYISKRNASQTMKDFLRSLPLGEHKNFTGIKFRG